MWHRYSWINKKQYYTTSIATTAVAAALLVGCGSPSSTTTLPAAEVTEEQPSCFSVAVYEVDQTKGFGSVDEAVKSRVAQYTQAVADLATKPPSIETTEDVAQTTAILTSVTALLKPTEVLKPAENVTRLRAFGPDGVLTGGAEVTNFNGKFLITQMVYLDPQRIPGKNCSMAAV